LLLINVFIKRPNVVLISLKVDCYPIRLKSVEFVPRAFARHSAPSSQIVLQPNHSS
jgi:hypothetical protein